MRQNCYSRPGDSRDSPARIDIRDAGCPVVDRESIIELGCKVRQEVERFINGNIHDSTKGWPLLSRMPRRWWFLASCSPPSWSAFNGCALWPAGRLHDKPTSPSERPRKWDRLNGGARWYNNVARSGGVAGRGQMGNVGREMSGKIASAFPPLETGGRVPESPWWKRGGAV